MLSYFSIFDGLPPAEIYTLSLHDALPISWGQRAYEDDIVQGRFLNHSSFILNTPDAIRHVLVDNYEKDRKSTRLNSSHSQISYAVFCLKKKKNSLSYRTKKRGQMQSLHVR